MSRSGRISTGRRTPPWRALPSLASCFPGLLIFFFAAISFSLGNAQALSLGRSGGMGTEKTAQNLYIGTRDANRLVLSVERKDVPQTNWSGGDCALQASNLFLCLLSGTAARGGRVVAPLKSPARLLGFQPRAPPAMA